MSHQEFSQKRFPVIHLDGHYCLLTLEPLNRNKVPSGLHCYDIQNAGPSFEARHHVPASYRLGSILCKDVLPVSESGTYCPDHISALNMAEPPTAEEFLRLSDSDLAQEQANGYLYFSNFGPVPVYPVFHMYMEGNLFLGFDFYDEEEQMKDHFASITVNIDRLPYLQSTIDTNNNGQKILDFLTRNGFGTCTGRTMHSGFCLYPVFLFDEQTIHRLDPEFFQRYAQAHGRNPAILAETKLSGKLQQAANRSCIQTPSQTAHTIPERR